MDSKKFLDSLYRRKHQIISLQEQLEKEKGYPLEASTADVVRAKRQQLETNLSTELSHVESFIELYLITHT